MTSSRVINVIKKYRFIVSIAVILITTYFFANTLKNNWQNVQDYQFAPNAYSALAILLFVISVALSGHLWGEIISRLSRKKVATKEAIRVHFSSWLLKYVPGQAGSLINKLAWGKKEKIDGKLVTASFIYENTFLLLASTVPTIPILLLGLSSKFFKDASLFLPLLIVAPFVLFLTVPKFFNATINKTFKILGKKEVAKKDLLNMSENLSYFIKFIGPRIVNGAAFVFVAISLFHVEPKNYIVFAAVYVLAGIIGILAIFVPSGLGIREAVIVLFLSAYMPAEQAIIISVVARLYATVADLFIAATYFWLNKGIARAQ